MQGSYSQWREKYDKNATQPQVDPYGKRAAEGEPSMHKKKKGMFQVLCQL